MARPADPTARSALLDAARSEFARSGIKGARIEDITARCGLSKGAFYLHFASKEALFKELVSRFQQRTDALLVRRKEEMAAFFVEHGPLNARDVQKKTPRYERLLEVETALDREVLGVLWEYRDVFGVLVSGSQGTEFQGLVWQLAQREVQRVQDDFEAVKAVGACRTDVPSEVFGSMVVGTWLLIAQQMSRMAKRPDLDHWVEALHRLIREGSAPQQQTARAKLKVLRRAS
jgi:AcrR family transcriptional regulator